MIMKMLYWKMSILIIFADSDYNNFLLNNNEKLYINKTNINSPNINNINIINANNNNNNI